MKEDNSFKNFDRELYNHIINITKEPFLLWVEILICIILR
jgi:hypothetical protein